MTCWKETLWEAWLVCRCSIRAKAPTTREDIMPVNKGKEPTTLNATIEQVLIAIQSLQGQGEMSSEVDKNDVLNICGKGRRRRGATRALLPYQYKLLRAASHGDSRLTIETHQTSHNGSPSGSPSTTSSQNVNYVHSPQNINDQSLEAGNFVISSGFEKESSSYSMDTEYEQGVNNVAMNIGCRFENVSSDDCLNVDYEQADNLGVTNISLSNEQSTDKSMDVDCEVGKIVSSFVGYVSDKQNLQYIDSCSRYIMGASNNNLQTSEVVKNAPIIPNKLVHKSHEPRKIKCSVKIKMSDSYLQV